MYVTTIFPTKKNHTLEIPKEFYDKEIIVTAQTVSKYPDTNKEEQILELDKIFNKYRKINLSTFKFDRNEANNFDV